MSSVTLPDVDPRDYRIGSLLFQRLWQLIKPYWFRRGAMLAWIALATTIGIALFSSAITVKLSFTLKEMTDALIAKRGSSYWPLLFLFVLTTLGQYCLQSASQAVGAWLNKDWRVWLTTDLVDRYLSRRTYYDIVINGGIDNPDQRIQESVAPFVQAATSFPSFVLLQVTLLVTGSAILATIDARMVPAVVAFGILQAILTYVTQVPTIKKNYQITVSEADLRYGILHVRDHAEAVAFYGGEAVEREQILLRLHRAAKRQLSLLLYNAGVVSGTNNVLQVLWLALPYFILVPLYLSGKISYGSIAQAVLASGQIIFAIGLLLQNIPTITAAAPGAVRLAQIMERFEAIGRASTEKRGAKVVVRTGGDDIHITNLNLYTPASEQKLINDLNLTVSPNENIVVVGQTGVGKSSLLRAMAGLWTVGSGEIVMPGAEHCMFLPQRPYMILSDLRSQLNYPGRMNDRSDEELQAVLEAVKLPHLAANYGGFSEIRDWGKVLSLGEQQRISFARMMIAKPRFVFLDEATSAVDFATEALLYKRLRDSGATFISVGHRLSILDYHTHMLTILGGGGWRIERIDPQVAEAAATFTTAAAT